MAFSKAEAGKTRIGWIGTGVMGRWMCQHLMTKGYKATVYNRSKSKAQPLLEQGAASDTKPPITLRATGFRALKIAFSPDGHRLHLVDWDGSRLVSMPIWDATPPAKQ